MLNVIALLVAVSYARIGIISFGISRFTTISYTYSLYPLYTSNINSMELTFCGIRTVNNNTNILVEYFRADTSINIVTMLQSVIYGNNVVSLTEISNTKGGTSRNYTINFMILKN